jgi:nitrogen-specific signal transduction histidine kinase/FixJ family two-component response regulator
MQIAANHSEPYPATNVAVADLPVLFVDDEQNVLAALRRTVKRCGWESMFVASAQDALEVVATQEFAAVVSDYRMPGMNGVDLLERVRRRWPLTERILLTGNADIEALERGINEARVTRFMRKPWEPDALIDILAAAVQQCRIRRENAVLVEQVRNRNEELRYLNQLLSDRVVESDRTILGFRRRWDVALNAISDAIAIVTPDHRIEGANVAAGHLAGKNPSALEGAICHEALLGRPSACDACPMNGRPGRISTRHDGSALTFDARAYLLPGPTTAHLCVYRDITEALAFERRAAHMERMAAMGRLAAGVAHELNNPLHAVSTFVQLAQQPCATPEKLKRYHEVILESSVRCSEIIQTMRGLARRDDCVDRHPTDLREVCQKALLLFEAEVDSRIERDWDEGQAYLFAGSANQLHQVIVNLVQNAIDAGPENGRIRLGLSVDDEAIICTVEDDGPGVPEAEREHIFEPFFTTKPEGVGTGLGLAISHRIIDELGGSLGVCDGALGGARFEIRLPRVSAANDSETGGEHA